MSDRFVWPRYRQPWEGPAQYDWLQHELSLRLGSRGRWMGGKPKKRVPQKGLHENEFSDKIEICCS